MAIVKMKKVYILSNKTYLSAIIETLEQIGIVQIANVFEGSEVINFESPLIPHAQNEEEIDTNVRIDENILKLHYALNFLPALPSEKKSFIEGMVGGKTSISFQSFNNELSSFNFNALFEQCKKLEEENNKSANEKKTILKLIDDLLPWKNLNDNISEISNTEKTFTFFLRINSNIYDKFKNLLNEDIELENGFILEKIQEEMQQISCIIIGHKNIKDKIENLLKLCSIVPFEFPYKDYQGKVKDLIQKSYEKIQAIDVREKEIQAKKIILAENRQKLTLLYDDFISIKSCLNVQVNFGYTQHTITIKCWIKDTDTEKLNKELNEITDEILITFYDPTPDKENVPIALKNNRFVKPFELIVRLYGMPNYQEKDPTPIIAPFFALIFAFALSDAIYGILLAGLAYYLLKKNNFDDETQDIFWLFVICGIATIGVGAIMGSWCGDLADYVPASLGWITQAKNSVMLFDPLKDLFKFIAVCLGLGIIHVFTGMGFKAYQNVLKGNYQDAFFDQITWIGLVASLIGLGLGKGNIISASMTENFSWGAKICTLIILFFGARDVKNIFGRIGVGLYKLYGTSSYIADILSYIRLLALGLATGIVGMVVNKMAVLPAKAPLGFIFVTLILVAGHIFNLVINLLGAFVHTCRLHYVEFFGKFYDNGGKAFNPFRKEGKYFIIK